MWYDMYIYIYISLGAKRLINTPILNLRGHDKAQQYLFRADLQTPIRRYVLEETDYHLCEQHSQYRQINLIWYKLK